MEGNKDVVIFPRTSIMNALAVCSIDFNSKMQIETSDEKITLIQTRNDFMFFWHRMYVPYWCWYHKANACDNTAKNIMTIFSFSFLRNFCQSVALPAEGLLKILCTQDNLAARHNSFKAGAFFKTDKHKCMPFNSSAHKWVERSSISIC